MLRVDFPEFISCPIDYGKLLSYTILHSGHDHQSYKGTRMNQHISRSLSYIGVLIISVLIGWQCATEPSTPVTPAGTGAIQQKNPVNGSITTGYPDLAIDSARLAQSIKFSSKVFKSTDCAVNEGCAVAGKRKLVRFDVATPNFGTADLFLGPPSAHPDWFIYSPCHGHYHLQNFSEYRLRNASGVVVTGHKQAFCLEDVAQYWSGYPSNGYTCANQGISVGWGDIYGSYLDCQWLDITNVPPGNYTIEVVINKSGLINEGPNAYSDSIDVPVKIR